MDKETISAISDSVTACSSALTAIAALVALKSLSNWKNERRSDATHDLVRRCLRCAHDLRNSINDFSRANVTHEELVAATSLPVEVFLKRTEQPDEVATLNDTSIKPDHIDRVMQRRFENVHKVQNEMMVVAAEAGVVWGKSAYKAFLPLSVCAAKTKDALDALFALRTQPQNTELTGIARIFKRDTPELQSFRNEVMDAIDKVEELCRNQYPH